MQLEDVLAIVASRRSRTVLALNTVLSALALLVMQYDIVVISADYQDSILTWAVSSLIGSGLFGLNYAFVTREVKDAACSFCGSRMTTKTLKCTNCPAVSSLGE
jgi:hypothetical protein